MEKHPGGGKEIFDYCQTPNVFAETPPPGSQPEGVQKTEGDVGEGSILPHEQEYIRRIPLTTWTHPKQVHIWNCGTRVERRVQAQDEDL